MKPIRYSQLEINAQLKAIETLQLEQEIFGQEVMDKYAAHELLLATDQFYRYDEQGYFLGSNLTGKVI
jgi:hypothetical protein